MSDAASRDYVQYRLERARETIDEVRIHIANEFWNTAINRMYYACFYAINALMAHHKIEVHSHAGVRQKFGEHFVKTGLIDKKLARHFTELFDKRQKGDYNDFLDYDKETVMRLYPLSEELIVKIEEQLKG